MTDQNRALDAATGREKPLIIDVAAGRRAFIQTLGMAGLSAAALGGGLGTGPASAQGVTDLDILNFALNLEYLEAEFYLHAAFGYGLSRNDIDGPTTPGAVSGGRQVNFATAAFAGYAREIARDEQNHVKFLRAALGPARVSRPQIDIDFAFTAAARAAGLVSRSDTFDVYASEANFLLGAFIFEDVGVTAYKGAAPLLQNKDYLAAAAGLLAVEAYHAAEVRTLLFSLGYFVQTQRISNLRDSVDGADDLDQGIGNMSNPNIVPTDANSLVFSRTPQQVLPIVYLGGQTSGGFFPAGLNGNIR